MSQNLRPILFLCADPSDASRLRLGEEMREIRQNLQMSQMREEFPMETRTAIRPSDISRSLLEINPNVVHFSGHGSVDGAICLEDANGNSMPVSPQAIAELFKQFSGSVQCVILNSCYSSEQASAIGKYIPVVIGMNQTIGDKAAIAFSVGFYQALGAGKCPQEAYRFGCAQIHLQGIQEYDKPIIFWRGRRERGVVINSYDMFMNYAACTAKMLDGHTDGNGGRRIAFAVVSNPPSWNRVFTAVVESIGPDEFAIPATAAVYHAIQALLDVALFHPNAYGVDAVSQFFDLCVEAANAEMILAMNSLKKPSGVFCGAKVAMVFCNNNDAFVASFGNTSFLVRQVNASGDIEIRALRSPAKAVIDSTHGQVLNAPIGNMKINGDMSTKFSSDASIIPHHMVFCGPNDYIAIATSPINKGNDSVQILADGIHGFTNIEDVVTAISRHIGEDHTENMVACLKHKEHIPPNPNASQPKIKIRRPNMQ